MEIPHQGSPGKKPVSRGAQRIELVSRIKEVIRQEKSWKDVGNLLAELEKLL